LLIEPLTPNDLRRDDPFVRAVVDYFRDFVAAASLPRPVEGYLAGGLAVRCYTGSRVTGDVDMFFPGARVLVPPDTLILVRAEGRERTLLFDHQYTPDFGLLHPDYAGRAVGLATLGSLWLRVLHPVDLAITKLARFQDHDRADIAALAATRRFDRAALQRLAEEAMAYAVGILAFARENLAGALAMMERTT
jgi:hypothetical protein